MVISRQTELFREYWGLVSMSYLSFELMTFNSKMRSNLYTKVYGTYLFHTTPVGVDRSILKNEVPTNQDGQLSYLADLNGSAAYGKEMQLISHLFRAAFKLGCHVFLRSGAKTQNRQYGQS